MTEFSFGRNWDQFIKNYLTEERVEAAKKHILDFLEIPDLKGRSFLDIGCGSGIHSLAALKAGAAKVISFDVDPYSVETTRRVREMSGSPETWDVLSGSILDEKFLSGISLADIVYSWGCCTIRGICGRQWKTRQGSLRITVFFTWRCT